MYYHGSLGYHGWKKFAAVPHLCNPRNPWPKCATAQGEQDDQDDFRKPSVHPVSALDPDKSPLSSFPFVFFVPFVVNPSSSAHQAVL